MKNPFAIFVALIGFAFSFSDHVLPTSNPFYQKKAATADTLANAHLGDKNTNELFSELVLSANDETYVNDTYASYYFSNLRENFGNNIFGSCGYVSVGMLLSFYDAHWDDDLVSNSYDIKSTYTGTMQPFADFYLVPSTADSPGVKFEPSSLINNVDIEEYLNLADRNKEIDFQFKLFDLAKQCFGSINFDNGDGSLGLTGQGIYDLLDYYIHDYKGYSDSEAVIGLYGTSDASLMKSKVVNNISKGNPVILVVKQPNTTKAHSVVAYDYDSSNSEIYVHTGWRDEGKWYRAEACLVN